MLTSIVRFSLRFRGVVIALACVLVAGGVFSLTRAKYDVFPEFTTPQVVIQTEAPGLSPEQVEVLVTQPIENAINGVAGIESLRSQSIQGVSVITVNFHPGSEIHLDRQVLSERLAALTGQLPQGVEAPVMTPLTSSTGDLMSIGLTSSKRTLMELRTIADWVVSQKLLAVPGVAKVAPFGGEVRQLQIQVRPEQLVARGLSIQDVLSAARRATGVRGAGFVDTPNQRIGVQTEGQSIAAEALAQTVVRGPNVTLGDVAVVTEAPEPPISGASVMGEPGVILNIWAQYGSNTIEATEGVERALKGLEPALRAQDVTLHADLFRAANFVDLANGNVRASLLIGAVLVIVVLFLFLFDLRTAAISCTAIPLSLLAGVTTIQALGFSLNTMTLGGLAIAIGEVVDDAVIDVENILRRLRSNRDKSSLAVVLGASIEVRSAVVYATFAVALVFMPVLAMSGLAGRLFSPLALAYVFSTLASLVVALTVTPALCLVLLGRRRISEREPLLARVLKQGYTAILRGVERHSSLVVLGVALFTAAGVTAMPFLGGEFLPEFREGHFVVHMNAVPGTSIAESLRMGKQVTDELLKLPFVRKVGQRVGRASADDTFGPHSSEFEVDLKPLDAEAAEEAPGKMREALAKFPGVAFAINTFLTERIEETLSGFTAPVVVNVFGNDLDALDDKAKQVARSLNEIPGKADVQMQSVGTPQMAVRLRSADLRRWGFQAVDVLEAVRSAYQGEAVGQVYEGNRVFGVSVILEPTKRNRVSDLEALPLQSPTGVTVTLRQVADVYPTSGRYLILHEGARRVQTITCNVQGRDVESFEAEARRKLTSTGGTSIEFGGTSRAQARSKQELLMHSVLAAVGIVLLLSVVMGSLRNLLLVLLNLPFAFVGGVIAMFASGGDLSMGSLVGCVTLFGITLRNSIMMISHYEHLVLVEGLPWTADTAVRGASERLIPILMTFSVTALGLLPLALGSGAAGREIEGPMAMVILGGLVTSTALNLLVLPTLALRFARFERVAHEALP